MSKSQYGGKQNTTGRDKREEDVKYSSKRNRNQNTKRGSRNKRGSGQPRKDSNSPRINLDNERIATFAKDMEKDHNNDVSWYSHNPELLKSAGSYGFSYLTGQPLPFVGFGSSSTTFGRTVPGVMAFHWVPTYGGANIKALNQSAKALYSYVVHANSRNKSYDANDLMLTILATEQVFALLASMIRAYGVAKKYSDRDVYTPSALLQAMGFNPSDIRRNLATMWFDINELVSRAVQLWIPKNLPFVARQFWMNTNIYKDSETSKAQYYLYVQSKYFAYVEDRFSTGGALEPAKTSGGNVFTPGDTMYNWSDWMGVANNMFNALLNSQDRGVMLGDVLKAYGKENLYALNEITSSYLVDYVYSSEVLSQFENLTVSEVYRDYNGLIQNMDSNELESYFMATKDSTWYAGSHNPPKDLVLNFHQNETPSAEQIMVATRMMAGPASAWNVSTVNTNNKPSTGWGESGQTVSSNRLYLPSCVGTEVCVRVRVWYVDPTSAAEGATYDNLTTYMTDEATYTPNYNASDMGEWSAFDWAPWIYYIRNTNDTTTTVSFEEPLNTAYAIGDWDNYTILGSNDLLKLHTAAVYSEFGVPVL